MRTIRAPEVRQTIEEDPDAIVINVLGGDSFRRAHIPESRNVPLGRDDFVEAVRSLAGHEDRRLIVHCSSHDCDASPEAAAKLEDAGFTDVIEFPGGIAEWKQAGYRLEKSQTIEMA